MCVTTTKALLDRIDRLLGLVRRCERLVVLCTDETTRSPELIRAVAELRIELAADDRYRLLEHSVSLPTVEAVKIGLANVKTSIAQDQRRMLATRGAA
jgi:hypothetical protein